MASLNKYIKGRMKYYFMQKLGAEDYRKGWMKAKCPHCGKDFKYGINLSLDRTNCFRCGAHPSPVTLIMDLENLDTFGEFLQYINQDTLHTLKYNDESVELKEAQVLDMPEGFNLLGNIQDNLISKAAHHYITKRGFLVADLRRMGWGYCDSGPLLGYLIIPFFHEGKLLYYNARRFVGSGPRYKNPDTDTSGLGKSFIIYNKEALELYDRVFICEGAINAATLGPMAIAMGGKSISRYQLNQLIKSSPRKVVILLDPDAKLKAIEVALKLSEIKKVKVVILPEGKDINDLGKSITLKYIRNTPYQTRSQLLSIKSRILQNESTIHSYN